MNLFYLSCPKAQSTMRKLGLVCSQSAADLGVGLDLGSFWRNIAASSRSVLSRPDKWNLRGLTAIIFVLYFLSPSAVFAELKKGDPAPDFTIDAAKAGSTFSFSLSTALKDGPVVLYFYPKSFTSVCTIEAHEFAENIEKFTELGASVIGVSSDNIDVQRDFSRKECRDKFPVGADPSSAVIKSYDVAMPIPVIGEHFANRTSYVISPDQKIFYVYSDPAAEKHIANTLAAVRMWRSGFIH